MTQTTLHLLCGKIASGKSTLARSLAAQHGAMLLSEDNWLSKLYPEQIKSVGDYVRFAHQIRGVVGPIVTDILNARVNVVLDFPANTLANRQWLRGLVQASGAAIVIHHLLVDDDVCRSRLHQRNAGGEHDFAATDAEFDLITSYYQPPGAEEGLEIEIHRT